MSVRPLLTPVQLDVIHDELIVMAKRIKSLGKEITRKTQLSFPFWENDQGEMLICTSYYGDELVNASKCTQLKHNMYKVEYSNGFEI
jgi:hypothetical protein